MRKDSPGNIVILNGTPRSGKSSIAQVIQSEFPGYWLNMGVDRFMQMQPSTLHPGIGLRPGGEAPHLEPYVRPLYEGMYDSIAAFSRQGFNVVVDVGHHDQYSQPLGILPTCARKLRDFPVLFVGVRCPLEVIMERRRATGWQGEDDFSIPEPVRRWQEAVHEPGIYDLEVDTSSLTPEQCAGKIRPLMESMPSSTAFSKLAELNLD